MKTFWTLIILTISLWCSPVFAEYCGVSSIDRDTSCIFKTERTNKDAQIIVSYTQQGWSMKVAVFFKKEFPMIEGDSKVQIKNGETHDIEYVSTRRDITLNRGRRMMEESAYLVSEALLHELSNAKGKVKFLLSAEESKEVEVEFSASLFEDLDAYIAETKMVLSELFEDE